MTYDELLPLLRRDLLAEVADDYWTDADLFQFLRRAATEVATELGFPTRVDDIAVAQGDTSFTLPADTATERFNEVSFGGFRLTYATDSMVSELAAQGAVGAPRHYHVDPRRSGSMTVRFGPPAPAAGTMRVDVVLAYDGRNDEREDEPWLGTFPRFHELVAYRAAAKAFESSLENDRAQYMLQRSQGMFMSLAAMLGKTDVAQLMLGQAEGQVAAT